MLTGVVEVGLFCHMAQAAYFGNAVRFPHFASDPNVHPDNLVVVVAQDGSLTVRWADGRLEHLAKGAKA